VNYPDLKVAALHFFEPLKAPVAAIGGGVGSLVALDAAPSNIWIPVIQIVVVMLMLRTILFFEFRVHERKEQRLYEAILATSTSFDNVAGSLRRDLKELSGRVEDLEADDDKTAKQVEEHESRIKALEQTPLVARMLVRPPPSPADPR
jgi:hypothetical protein